MDDIVDNARAACDVDDLVKMRVTNDPMSQKTQLFQIACNLV